MTGAIDDRLEESIRQIGAAGYGNLGQYRDKILTMVKVWRWRATAAEKEATVTNMTSSISGGKTATIYKQAIVLVFSAANSVSPRGGLLGNDGLRALADRIKQLGQGQAILDAAFQRVVHFALGYTNETTFINQKLGELKADPWTFLQTYRLKISGTKDGPAEYNFFYVIDNASAEMASHDWIGGGVEGFGLSQYQRAGAANLSVPVINVPASDFKDQRDNVLKGLDNVAGTGVVKEGNRILMTTTQFTGCSFCFQKTGEGIVAAHMNPDERVTGISGMDVRTAMVNRGGFSNEGLQGDMHVFGCTNDEAYGYAQANRKYMTILGQWSVGLGWRLFSQFNGQDGSFSARQIYPKI